MKVFFKRAVTTLLAATMFSCSLTTGDMAVNLTSETRTAGNVRRASQNPPNGIPVSETPQFISFGFEDNGDAKGLQGVLDIFNNKVNPDNTKPTITLFNTTLHIDDIYSGPEISALWKKAYLEGHEIGNHTDMHKNGKTMAGYEWRTEINTCTSKLKAALGPDVTIQGLRAPYLEYNNALYDVLKENNMYDNSIEEGYQSYQDGTNFYWPYTLDYGSPGNTVFADWGAKELLNPKAGVWVMPVYTLIVPEELRAEMKTRQGWFDVNTGKIPGDEFTVWVLLYMNKAEYLATLKHTFNLRITGNRAPMILGSNAYNYNDADFAAKGASAAERRAALNEFLDYALSHKAVRITSLEKTLAWVKNPVAIPTDEHIVTPVAGPHGSVSPASAFTVKKGEGAVVTVTPDAGFEVQSVTINNEPVALVNNQVVLASVTEDTVISVNFKHSGPAETVRLNLVSGKGGHLSPEGIVEVNKYTDKSILVHVHDGYILDSAFVNNELIPVGQDNLIQLTDISVDTTVEVYFRPSSANLIAEYKITQDWGTGFGADLVITNISNADIHSWKAVLTYQNDELITGWGANISQRGRVVTAANLSWNGTIKPGASVNVGFNGKCTNGTSHPLIYIE